MAQSCEDATQNNWKHILFRAKSDDKIKRLAVFLLALLSYWNSLFGEFVFDDIEAIVKNRDVHWPLLTKFTTAEEGFWRFLFNDFWGMPMGSIRSHKSWRPLTILSFRLNYMFNGLQPFCYHLVNVFLHGAVSVLSMDFYASIQPPQGSKQPLANLPFWSSLLFACHPVHVEAVASIVGRAEIISALLFICSFLEYCKASKEICPWRKWHLFTSLLLSFMALTAKEQGVTAIVFCIAYDVLLISRYSLTCSWKEDAHTRRFAVGCNGVPNNTRTGAKRRIGTLLIAFIIFAMIRLQIMAWTLPRFSKGDGRALSNINFVLRIANHLHIYLLNLWLLFCPSLLCFDYSMGCIEPIQSISDFRLWLVLFCVSALTALTCVLKNRLAATERNSLRHLMLGVSGMVIPFIPASNMFFTVGFVLAERILYLPSLGFCWIAAYFMLRMKASNAYGLNKSYCTGFFCFTLAAFTSRCILRNSQWLNEWTLFTSGLSVCPNNAKVHYNLGKLSAKAGRIDDAFKHYKNAVDLNGDYDFALNNLAILFLNFGLYANAEELLKRAVTANHEFAIAWMNLGTVQTMLNKYREAELSYKIAIRYQPKCADCFYNMGNMYNNNNDTKKAVASWLKAVKINQRYAEAWTNLIIAARNWETDEAALRIGFLALKVLPNHGKIHYTIANCYAHMGDYDRSTIHFNAAIRSNPAVKKHYTSLKYLRQSRRKGLQYARRQNGLFSQLHP